MSGFTTVIIIWAIYQLGASLMKKGKQQTPDGRSRRGAMQGTSQGSWREQMQQALQNSSRQMEEWTAHLQPLKSSESNDIEDGYVQIGGTRGSEGTQGTMGIRGIEGTSAVEGMPEVGIYRDTDENLGEGMPKVAQAMSGDGFSMTNRELVQGVVWAEILGKPRALHPFKGPRS